MIALQLEDIFLYLIHPKEDKAGGETLFVECIYLF
jgi:hypothetical protein